MKTSTKLMLIAMLAFAAGGTCPSDVNNDGTVGINDFLQVLGDWGECGEPVIILMASDNTSASSPAVRGEGTPSTTPATCMSAAAILTSISTARSASTNSC